MVPSMIDLPVTLGAVGAYTADRAASLSGVPRSTIHDWARNDVLVPSVSQERVKPWSYSDLLGLRTIYWLRQEKTHDDGRSIQPTTMPKVRRALSELRRLDVSLWEADGPRIRVDQTGHVFVVDGEDRILDGNASGQTILPYLDLIAPLQTFAGAKGPDLNRPRPNLRILPGKLSGSPHIEATRLETVAVAALSRRGFSILEIHDFYPFADGTAIAEAIELEEQLEQNLRAMAA
jgi:uncharacterized protein (DUF433 family)